MGDQGPVSCRFTFPNKYIAVLQGERKTVPSIRYDLHTMVVGRMLHIKYVA